MSDASLYECSPRFIKMRDERYGLNRELGFSLSLPVVKITSLFDLKEKVLDGVYEVFSEKDEQLLERMTYYQGKKQGKHVLFFSSGGLAAERWYVDDCLWGRAFDYFPEGTVRAEYGYKQGRQHGLIRMWRPDGTLQMKGNYCDGALDGTFELLDEEERPTRIVHFSEGKRSGPDSGFSEDGYLLFLDMWKRGVRQPDGFIDYIERFVESEILRSK